RPRGVPGRFNGEGEGVVVVEGVDKEGEEDKEAKEVKEAREQIVLWLLVCYSCWIIVRAKEQITHVQRHWLGVPLTKSQVSQAHQALVAAGPRQPFPELIDLVQGYGCTRAGCLVVAWLLRKFQDHTREKHGLHGDQAKNYLNYLFQVINSNRLGGKRHD
ncbi:uncharacterized protein BJX67DRAFT_343995, partial [Aspergillus lucknowensis]